MFLGRSLHKPTDIAHSKTEVRPCMQQVSQTPYHTPALCLIYLISLTRLTEFQPILHGCVCRIAICHAHFLKYPCCITRLTKCDTFLCLFHFYSQIITQQAQVCHTEFQIHLSFEL